MNLTGEKSGPFLSAEASRVQAKSPSPTNSGTCIADTQLSKASDHLENLAGRMGQDYERAPSFLMVLTVTAVACLCEDGICGALGTAGP